PDDHRALPGTCKDFRQGASHRKDDVGIPDRLFCRNDSSTGVFQSLVRDIGAGPCSRLDRNARPALAISLDAVGAGRKPRLAGNSFCQHPDLHYCVPQETLMAVRKPNTTSVMRDRRQLFVSDLRSMMIASAPKPSPAQPSRIDIVWPKAKALSATSVNADAIMTTTTPFRKDR